MPVSKKLDQAALIASLNAGCTIYEVDDLLIDHSGKLHRAWELVSDRNHLDYWTIVNPLIDPKELSSLIEARDSVKLSEVLEKKAQARYEIIQKQMEALAATSADSASWIKQPMGKLEIQLRGLQQVISHAPEKAKEVLAAAADYPPSGPVVSQPKRYRVMDNEPGNKQPPSNMSGAVKPSDGYGYLLKRYIESTSCGFDPEAPTCMADVALLLNDQEIRLAVTAGENVLRKEISNPHFAGIIATVSLEAIHDSVWVQRDKEKKIQNIGFEEMPLGEELVGLALTHAYLDHFLDPEQNPKASAAIEQLVEKGFIVAVDPSKRPSREAQIAALKHYYALRLSGESMFSMENESLSIKDVPETENFFRQIDQKLHDKALEKYARNLQAAKRLVQDHQQLRAIEDLKFDLPGMDLLSADGYRPKPAPADELQQLLDSRCKKGPEVTPCAQWSELSVNDKPPAAFFRELDALSVQLGVTPRQFEAAFVDAAREQIALAAQAIVEQGLAGAGQEWKGPLDVPDGIRRAVHDAVVTSSARGQVFTADNLDKKAPDASEQLNGLLAVALHEKIATVDLDALRASIAKDPSAKKPHTNMQANGILAGLKHFDKLRLGSGDLFNLQAYANLRTEEKADYSDIRARRFSALSTKVSIGRNSFEDEERSWKVEGKVVPADIFRLSYRQAAQKLAGEKGLDVTQQLQTLDEAFKNAVEFTNAKEKEWGVVHTVRHDPQNAEIQPYQLSHPIFNKGARERIYKARAGKAPDFAMADRFSKETRRLRDVLDSGDPAHKAVAEALLAPAVLKVLEAGVTGKWRDISSEHSASPRAIALVRAIYANEPDDLLEPLSPKRRERLRSALATSPLLLACMTGNQAVVHHVANNLDEVRRNFAQTGEFDDAHEPAMLRDEAERIFSGSIVPRVEPASVAVAPAPKTLGRSIVEETERMKAVKDFTAEDLAGLFPAAATAAVVTSEAVASEPPAKTAAPANGKQKSPSRSPSPTPRKIALDALAAQLGRNTDGLKKHLLTKQNLQGYPYFTCSAMGSVVHITFGSRMAYEDADAKKIKTIEWNIADEGYERARNGVSDEATLNSLARELAGRVRTKLETIGFRAWATPVKNMDHAITAVGDDFLPPDIVMPTRCAIRQKTGVYQLEIESPDSRPSKFGTRPPVKLTVPLGVREIVAADRAALPAPVQAALGAETLTADGIAPLLACGEPSRLAARVKLLGARVDAVLQTLAEQKEAQKKFSKEAGKLVRQDLTDAAADIEPQNWVTDNIVPLTFSNDVASLKLWKPGMDKVSQTIDIAATDERKPQTITFDPPTLKLQEGRDNPTWLALTDIYCNPDTRPVDKKKPRNGGFGDEKGLQFYQRSLDLGTADLPLAIARLQQAICGDAQTYGITDQLRNHFAADPKAQICYKDTRAAGKHDDWPLGAMKIVSSSKGNSHCFGHDEVQRFVRDHMQCFSQDVGVHYAIETSGARPVVTFQLVRGNAEGALEDLRDPARIIRDADGNPVARSEPVPEGMDAVAFAERVAADVMQAARCHYSAVDIEPDPAIVTREGVTARFAGIDTQHNRKDLDPKKRLPLKDKALEGFPTIALAKPQQWLDAAIAKHTAARGEAASAEEPPSRGGAGRSKKPASRLKRPSLRPPGPGEEGLSAGGWTRRLSDESGKGDEIAI